VVSLTRCREKSDALSTLLSLHIITITAPSRDSPQHVSLLRNFQTSLRSALTGGGTHNSFGVPSVEVDHDVTVEALDEYATAQWEGILHYLVHSVGGGSQSGQKLTQSVTTLLTKGNLVKTAGKGIGKNGITQAGFSFLLQEVNAQVWTLLLLFIENAEILGMNSVEVLSFLFMLGSLELGKAYSTDTLTDSQRQTITHLVDFGLIYIPESTPSQFFPTRLATTLTSDATALRSVSAGFDAAIASGGGSKGFIIIETNYRVYAYTSSPLQIAVLSLFTHLYIRYPNLVAGKLTAGAIQRAIAHGITSDQIIAYLTTHAHPQLRKTPAALAGGPILPPTVVDQIRLWQLEQERMKTTAGFLFKDFESAKEYESCVRYAEEIGVYKWKSDAKRIFFVTRHEQLRDFIKSRKVK